MPDADKLTEAMRADAADAWGRLREKYPTERFYAFGLYTTPEGSYFVPFACGEEGLERVAAKYVANGMEPNVEKAKLDLRWSIPDSPYHQEATAMGQRVEAALKRRPETYELSDTAADREIHLRMSAAVAALKALDEEGLFGRGEARSRLTLLIEAGDREEDFVLRWAKKVNPPEMYKAFKERGPKAETIGRFTGVGTKKVYSTVGLAVSADRRLVATATSEGAFLFDVTTMKQLFCKRVPKRGESLGTNAVAMSHDGTRVAIGTAEWLTIVSGKDWKKRIEAPVEVGAVSLAAAPDGSWFAALNGQSRIFIFDSEAQHIRTLEGHQERSWQIDVSADGALLASIDSGAGLHIWNTGDWSLRRVIRVSGDRVTFDATGRLAATLWTYGDRCDRHVSDSAITRDGKRQSQVLAIWDVHSGELLRELAVPGHRFNAARFSPDGRSIVAAAERIEVPRQQDAVLLDANDGRVLQRLRGSFEEIYDFVFLPEQKAIAFAAYGHTLRPLTLWQLQG